MPDSPAHIYLSACAHDLAALQRLKMALQSAVRRKKVVLHSRQELKPGLDPTQAVESLLSSAALVVLLLSPDYVADNDMYAEAVQVLSMPQRPVVAVRLRPFVLLPDDPLTSVKLNHPTDGRTVSQWEDADAAWEKIALAILGLALEQAAASSPAEEAPPELSPLDRVVDSLFEGSFLHPKVLECDRTLQWGELDRLMNDIGQDELILVPGSHDRGHSYFMERIRTTLRRDPSRRIVDVQWDRAPFPLTEDEYRERLALSLRCQPNRLAAQLRQLLCHYNLVLLHRVVNDRFPSTPSAKAQALALFCEWLPRLLTEARMPAPGSTAPTRAVKCVQPIAWRPASSMLALCARAVEVLLGRLPLRLEDWLHAHRALRFMQALEHSKTPLAVFRLQAMQSIRDQDIEDICKQAAIPKQHWAQVVLDARRLAATDEKLFPSLSELLRDPRNKSLI